MARYARPLRYGCPALESIGPNKWERCHDNLEIANLVRSATEDKGIIPTADMPIIANPAGGDTMVFTVGMAVETFEFVVGAPATAYEITIGATEPETIDNAVAVINAITAFRMLASNRLDTYIRIQYAEAGVPAISTPAVAGTIALGGVMTQPASVWTQATLGDAAIPNFLYKTVGQIAATAENIAQVFDLPMEFIATDIRWLVRDAAGTLRPTCTATIAYWVGDHSLRFDLAAGGVPMIATDVIYFEAYGSVLVP